MTKLTELDLSCNHVTSFQNITKLLIELKSLITINLFTNPISKIVINDVDFVNYLSQEGVIHDHTTFDISSLFISLINVENI